MQRIFLKRKLKNTKYIVGKKDEMILIPMSDYQFLKYSEVRSAEIEMDKNKKKQKEKKSEEEEEIKSSYRAYSRIHCSFVFPESIKRPFPSDFGISDEEGSKLVEVFEEIISLTFVNLSFFNIPQLIFPLFSL